MIALVTFPLNLYPRNLTQQRRDQISSTRNEVFETYIKRRKGKMSTLLKAQYGLHWNPNPPVSVASVVTIALAAGVYTILSWLGVIALPLGFVSVSALFVAIGFGIPFTLWFGLWGLLIGYIGTFLGAGLLAGVPFLVALPFSAVDWLQFGIPLLAYRLIAPRIGLDPLGKDVYTRKGFPFFFVFGAILPNGLGAMYGISILMLAGLVPPDAWSVAVIGWWIGNIIVSLIIAPILLRTVTPIIERYGLTVHGLIT
jgi:hypothetical protein